MNLTEKISWNNLHIYFFYLFLFSIPFQTRKVFLTEYSFYSGSFTEYATFFVYASDVLLILTLIFWLVFNKKLYKHFNFENLKSAHKLPAIWLLLLVFIAWLIVGVVVNNNYIEISAFYILKFIELSLLIIYIYFNLRNKNKLIIALFTVSFAGFFQGLIAIYQFMYQCPLFKYPFLQKLTGESTVYPQLPGIAKIVVDNEKFVRAYGTFPHPNILGGFLIVSILISTHLLLKHKSYVLSRLSLRYNTINNNKSQVKTCSLLLSLSWIILIFTQITALLFTFSRTAWIGFLISLLLIGIFYIYHFKIVSRETIRIVYLVFIKIIRKILFIDTYWIPAFAGMTGMGGILNKLKNRINNNNNKIVSRETIRMVYLIFVKNIRKILFIDTFWIPAFAGMTKRAKIIKGIRMTKSAKIVEKKDIISKLNKKIVSRETISEKTIINHHYLFYHFKELVVVVLLTLTLIAIYFPQINSRINEEVLVSSSLSSDYLPSNYAFNDRIFYNNVSRETISENFIFGSGPGTFIFQINSYLTKNNINQKLEPWQYQPAHNFYLLIISEIGIIGFVIFTLFIAKIIIFNLNIIKKSPNKRFSLTNNSNNISIVSRETISKNLSPGLNYYLLAIFASFLFIGLFDHYFWTLQQGRLIFWLILGLMLVNSRNK